MRGAGGAWRSWLFGGGGRWCLEVEDLDWEMEMKEAHWKTLVRLLLAVVPIEHELLECMECRVAVWWNSNVMLNFRGL